jgi:hypothetical protein
VCGTLISNTFPPHKRVARDARFESPLGEATVLSEHYTSQAERRSRPSDDPLTFLDYCAAKMAEETSRARATLPDTSWDPVQATTESSLLLGHLDWLANGGEYFFFLLELFLNAPPSQ